MGKLTKRKTKLSVEFSDSIRERGKLREVLMDMTPFGITVRLKGLRAAYEITPAAIYTRAVLMQVERDRAEKTRKRGLR